MKFAIKFVTVFNYLFGIFCIVMGFLGIWNDPDNIPLAVALIVGGIYILSMTVWLCSLQRRVEHLEKHIPPEKQEKVAEQNRETKDGE